MKEYVKLFLGVCFMFICSWLVVRYVPDPNPKTIQTITIDDKYISYQQYGQDILLLTRPFSKDDRVEDHCIRKNGKIILIIREEE